MRRFLWLLLLVPLVSFAYKDPGPPSRLLVLGDSLSAAYGIPREAGWVTLFEARLKEMQPTDTPVVVNASVSGETTSGGLARLPALLAEHHPSLVLIELGANDGLRGLPLAEIRANVARLVKLARDAKATVVLIGIELPVNYGPQYRDGLRAVYRDVASEFNVPLVPFLLEGVALDESLMQDDGLHPTAAAQPRVFATVWEIVGPVLRGW